MEEDEDWEKMYAEDMEALEMMEKEQDALINNGSRRRLSFDPTDPPSGEIVIDYQLPTALRGATATRLPSPSSFSSSLASTTKRKFEETEEKEIAESYHKREMLVKAKRRKVEGEKTASSTATAAPTITVTSNRPKLAREPPKKKVYSNRPLDTPCIPVNSYDGRRVYVALHEEEVSEVTDPLAEREQLLSTPISVLLERVHQLEFVEARQAAGLDDGLDDAASNTTKVEENGAVESQLWVDKYAPRVFTELLSDEKTNREVLHWVKEWDECVFGKKSVGIRKAPSPAFAGRGRGSSRGRGGYGDRGAGGRWAGQRGWGTENNSAPAASSPQPTKKSEPQFDEALNKDRDNRPYAKVILLTGPPGLGKTTLAHVIATAAGYNPVEINASDDRTANLFMSKVLSATQMQAVFSEKKPNCLILDEIDGLTGGEKGAIKELLKVINAKDKKKAKAGQADDGEQGKGKGKKGRQDAVESSPKLKKGSSVLDLGKLGRKKKAPSASDLKSSLTPSGKLRRPIICICNDQYAPALRELRSIAKVFRFDKPDLGRLTSRLQEICNKEGLRADTQTVMALCNLADHDIRSCLNTLQFIKRKGKVLTADMLASTAVGHKDVLKSLYDVWREIFQKAAPSKHKALRDLITRQSAEKSDYYDTLGYDPDAPTRRYGGGASQHEQSRFDSLYETLADHGEMERIIDGCFENYLKFTMNDPCLAKTTDCLDWLEFTDEMSVLIQKEQHFTFRKYLPAAPMVINRHCSENSNPFVSFPQSDFAMRQKLGTFKNMVNTFIANSQPEIRGTLNSGTVVMELVPYLVDIIAPKIRQLNSALFSEEEKMHVQNAVGIMSSFKLTYKPSADYQPTAAKDPKGRTNRLRLEPPLDELVRFEGLDYDGRHRALGDAQKEMIAAEIKVEEIKKSERVAMKKLKDGPAHAFATPEKKPVVDEAKRRQIQEQLMKNTQKLVPEGAATVHRDFFGRVIASPQKEPARSPVKSPRKGEVATPTKVEESSAPPPAEVFYKFHEGFTNAVRRPVYTKDFL